MRKYYLVDLTHNKQSIKKLRTCELAARLRLYIGPNYTEEDIKKLWEYDINYPAPRTISNTIKFSNIKWYIKTYGKQLLYDSEWNPDFLVGMLSWGRIVSFSRKFPSFIWSGNNDLLQAIKSSPFYGILNINSMRSKYINVWSYVPSLCFNYSKDTIDYMAGVLSTGIITNYNNMVLVKYNHKVGEIIKKWNIPVEIQNRKEIFISPFWPVLLHKYMPKFLQLKWKYVAHAYRAKEYSSILWKVYTGKDPVVNGISYLMSRRSIFYKYGSLRALRDMWIKNHLVELDSRIKKVIQEFQKNQENNV